MQRRTLWGRAATRLLQLLESKGLAALIA